MKYKNTRRKGALLYLLNFVTLGFFFLFFFVRIRREIGTFSNKKGMPYPVAFLLGVITLQIVPLIWFANRAEALEEAASSLGIKGKTTNFVHMYGWLSFGFFLLFVGPFIAFHRFFNTLNKIEEKLFDPALADKMDEKAKEADKEEKKEDKNTVETVVAPIANSEKPLSLRTPRVRFDPSKGDGTGRYWSVNVDGRTHYFYRQSEAIAFAKRVAVDRGVNVTVYGKEETEEK